MPRSLLLDVTTWDLTADSSNNIAVADDPYALAQNAASAIRLFQGELWYDTTQGVPYWAQILGQRPSLALIKSKLVAAALTVPGVTAARVFITAFTNRGIRGQVQVTSKSGVISGASF